MSKDLERLINLNSTEAKKIRARQKAGTMSVYYDKEKYICYSKKELNVYKPRKKGRKSLVLSGKSNEVLDNLSCLISACKLQGFTTLDELITYLNCLEQKNQHEEFLKKLRG